MGPHPWTMEVYAQLFNKKLRHCGLAGHLTAIYLMNSDSIVDSGFCIILYFAEKS